MRTRTFLRNTALCVLALLLSNLTFAAGPSRYLAMVQELHDPHHQKLVMEMMNAAFPFTAYHVDLEAGTLEIAVAGTLDHQELEAALHGWGMTLSGLFRHHAHEGFASWVAVGGPHDYPQYTDTGDPELDQANYDAAKADWIANDPAAYRDLTQAGGRQAAAIRKH